MRTFDLVVIGAGIGGGSLVYNLLKQGFRGSILVLDRGETVASAASAHSAGGFRNLWTTPINQQLCTRSMELLGRFKEDMGVGIGFQPSGYLFTYYAEAWKQVPRAAEIWRANQVNFDLLSPEQVEALIPGLRCSVDAVDPEVREYLGLEAIAGGVFGRDCGSFDPSQARPATSSGPRPTFRSSPWCSSTPKPSGSCSIPPGAPPGSPSWRPGWRRPSRPAWLPCAADPGPTSCWTVPVARRRTACRSRRRSGCCS